MAQVAKKIFRRFILNIVFCKYKSIRKGSKMRIQSVNNNQNQYKQNFEGYWPKGREFSKPVVKTVKKISNDILTIATGKDTRVFFGEGGC